MNTPEYEIRADYDKDTIVVYQAYAPEIALPSLAAGRFVPPFSLGRMTWIKPSFLWMMERSGWGLKAGQEHVLAVRITRAGWEEALSNAVLTSYEPRLYRSYDEWHEQLLAAAVRVQWDPEKTIRGANLPHRSIQVGLSRHIVGRYVNEWLVELQDATPLVRKIYAEVQAGRADEATEMLPRERVYPMPEAVAALIVPA